MFTKFNENYNLKKWYPAKHNDFSSMYEVRSIKDLMEGLFIELLSDSIAEDENKKHKAISIHWPSYYVSYMESDPRARNLTNLDKDNKRWTFFMVEDSAYIDFIKKDSCGVEGENLKHFCIIGTNSIVDILSPYEPQLLDEDRNTIAGLDEWED